MATDRLKLLDPLTETADAQAIAQRYRCEYVDLHEASIDHELFRSIPVDLMFRYNFVPMSAQDGSLEIADRKSTRLNSSHTVNSYAVFCLKKKIHPEPILAATK